MSEAPKRIWYNHHDETPECVSETGPIVRYNEYLLLSDHERIVAELRKQRCGHGWRGDPPDRGDRIANHCPSCGGKSLFIGTGGWLTCATLNGDCTEPGVEHAIDALKAERDALRAENELTRAMATTLVQRAEASDAENATLRARVAELEADWRRLELVLTWLRPLDTRAQIDAAMAEEKR